MSGNQLVGGALMIIGIVGISMVKLTDKLSKLRKKS